MNNVLVRNMSRDMVIQRLKLIMEETVVSKDAQMVFENTIEYLAEDKDAKRRFMIDMLIDLIHDGASDEVISWVVKYSRKVIDEQKKGE